MFVAAGVYFAENSSKSNQYVRCPACGGGAISKNPIECKCDPEKNDLVYSMLISRVVLGAPYVFKNYSQKSWYEKRTPPPIKEDYPIDPDTWRPSDPNYYDSILAESMDKGGDSLKYRETIVYYRTQIYPEFVVKYRRK